MVNLSSLQKIDSFNAKKRRFFKKEDWKINLYSTNIEFICQKTGERIIFPIEKCIFPFSIGSKVIEIHDQYTIHRFKLKRSEGRKLMKKVKSLEAQNISDTMQEKSWAKLLQWVGAGLGSVIAGFSLISSFAGRGKLLSGDEDTQIAITVLIAGAIGGFLGKKIGRMIDNSTKAPEVK